MGVRDDRKSAAEKHIGLVRGILASETAATIASMKLYEDGVRRAYAPDEPRFDATAVSVERTDAVEAVCNAKDKACVLDFASYRYPGGGYERGAWAQEEALCSESNLYPVLEGLRGPYYEANRKSMCGELYTDRAMYLTDVVFLHGGTMLKREVIVCAAPNRTRALENHRSEAECDLSMRNRVQSVMGIAADNQVDTLVLGAFGCGVFGNDPKKVAGYFKDWLDVHPGVFENVVFAVPGGPNFEVFRDALDVLVQTEAVSAVQASADEEDEDEQDWLPPTEDGRWVFE